MKKILLIIFLFSLINVSFSQVGIRTGIVSSNLTKYEFNARTGAHLGVYYNFNIGNRLKVEPGFFYTQKGYNSKSPKITENINYIDIPILFRFMITPEFNVFAGPQASTPISRKYKLGNNPVNTSLQTIRGYDGAFVLGAGYQLTSGLNFQASYEIGMVNLNYFNSAVRSRALRISIGKTIGKN